jgi:hypothetical protein
MSKKSESAIAFMLVLLWVWATASVSVAQDNERRVVCASEAGERQHCAADTTAGVALVQKTGTIPYILGNNWGYDAQGVWVSDGYLTNCVSDPRNSGAT